MNQFGSKDIMLKAGWLDKDEEVFCPECMEYYRNIKPVVGDQVVCLIQDDNRQLVAGRNYIVCETPYNRDSSTVKQKDRDNIAIYVSMDDSWQSKLTVTQYDNIQ